MRHLFLLPLLAIPLHGAEPLPGHSAHGEAFNEGPRQAAVLIPGYGDAVKFPISTKNADAQKFFTQGIGQLHGFWYYEAERSFRQAAAHDQDCPMAYWGMAMANVNNDKRAKGFLSKAVKLKDKASAREKQWIAMLENLYKDDKRDKKQRQLDCISDLETLVQEDPKDIEAKAFLVWRIWFGKSDVPISSAQVVDAMLDQIFAIQPNHPAHHYRIHLWDDRKPIRAVTSAAQCGQAAPGIAHMWHMPGHTYSKLKRFDDAVWQQEASTRVDHAYMIRSYILPDQIHNYAHNEEWLVRNFNELGRAKDAISLSKSLIGNPRHPSMNTLDKSGSSASYGRTRLIETLSKWELWDELKTFTSVPAEDPGHDITRLRSAGLAAYHQNDLKALFETLKSLEGIQLPKPKMSDKPEKAQASSKKTTETQKPDDKAKAISEIKLLIALLSPKTAKESPIKLLEALKESDIPKDRQARYWLKLNDKTKAAELAKNLPQDLAGSIAKAEILQASGKADEAKKAFDDVQKLAFAMDRDLPAFKRLTTTFAKDANWPAAAPKRTDSGVRPDLSKLGPIHWHPPMAPVFEALNLDAKPVKSTEFTSKKPTLFLFYLGHECGHCVEQMQAFAKAVADFEKAGIQLVGVTIEPSPVAKNLRTKLSLKKDQPLPFPILCDSSLEAFKKVRAYDDFEKETLHATVLIDTKGRQRWQDISYIPFSDTKFMLKEAKRLLNLD